MRLSLAFVSVALAAIALLAALTAVFAAADVDQLAQAQRLRLTRAMAVVAAASRDSGRRLVAGQPAVDRGPGRPSSTPTSR